MLLQYDHQGYLTPNTIGILIKYTHATYQAEVPTNLGNRPAVEVVWHESLCPATNVVVL